MIAHPIWSKTACETVDWLQKGDLHPSEVTEALCERVSDINPVVNALPTLCLDRAMDRADDAATRGPLFGLPVPVKDAFAVEGVRTTWGSLAFADHVPNYSDYAVRSLEMAGGLVYAKSNTPEFEAGANTFNEVFGRTSNPWNTDLSAAGSSGGAAVAVATGMAYIAQGADFACSVRYPASFNGICGLRPTPGLVPQGPTRLPYQTLSVVGPLARNVADLGLGLDALTGYEPGDPLTRPFGATSYRKSAEAPHRPERIAFSPDLGVAIVSKEVEAITTKAADRLAAEGLDIVRAHPNLDACHSAFRTLRAFQFSSLWSHVLETSRDKLKPEVVWNIEQGLKLTARDIGAAEADRAKLRMAMIDFLKEHGFLVIPTAPVPPYPAAQRYVEEIEGVAMPTYLDWLALGYAVTITGCPAVSIPCGFTTSRLPVGMQVIGLPHSENTLLSVAAWMQEVLGAGLEGPIDPKTGPNHNNLKPQ